MLGQPDCDQQPCAGAYNDDHLDRCCFNDEELQSSDSFLDRLLDCDALGPMDLDVEGASKYPLRDGMIRDMQPTTGCITQLVAPEIQDMCRRNNRTGHDRVQEARHNQPQYVPTPPCDAFQVPPWHIDAAGEGQLQPEVPGPAPIPDPPWPLPPLFQDSTMPGSMDAFEDDPFQHMLDAGAAVHGNLVNPEALGTEEGVQGGDPIDSCDASHIFKVKGQTVRPSRRRRVLNALAQQRYRVKQKKATQALHGTLQQLAKNVTELEEVKKEYASLQMRADALRLASAVADANISAHPARVTTSAAPCAAAESLTPKYPPADWLPDAEVDGGVGAAQGGARRIAQELCATVESARQFLATHYLLATQITMHHLSEDDAARARRLASACTTSCMEIWAAEIHDDVAQHIHSMLSQHTQRMHHELAPVEASTSGNARGSGQGMQSLLSQATAAPSDFTSAGFPVLLSAVDAPQDPQSGGLGSVIDRSTPVALGSGVDDLLMGTSSPQLPAALRGVLQPVSNEAGDSMEGSLLSTLGIQGTALVSGASVAPPQHLQGSSCSERSDAPEATVPMAAQWNACVSAAGAAEPFRQAHDTHKLLALAQRLNLNSTAKGQVRRVLRAHRARMHDIICSRPYLRLLALKELLPAPLGAAGYITDIGDDWRPRKVPTATARVLHALELSTMHERRAQQELVYVVSTRVLDAVQWCAVAAALHPLHCDLEPLLCAIAQLPETQPCVVSTATAFR